MKKVITIGVYGKSEDDFFDTLVKNDIKILWDIRQRRGMRGKTYSFVNSLYLQRKLQELGIQYQYFKQLSPTMEVRLIQNNIDRANRIWKKNRTELSPIFSEAYLSNLKDPEIVKILSDYIKADEAIALFCVECIPEACHRSVLAKKIADIAIVPIQNL
jgi:uncharacterized protein (DUF488 family)